MTWLAGTVTPLVMTRESGTRQPTSTGALGGVLSISACQRPPGEHHHEYTSYFRSYFRSEFRIVWYITFLHQLVT